MKSPDDPHQFDFHPWPRLLSGHRSGARSPGRMVIGSIILLIVAIDAALSDLSLGRWIVTGVIGYVVVVWMTRRRPPGPGS